MIAGERKKRLFTLLHLNPWLCIALLYTAQTAGALRVSYFMGLQRTTVTAPVILLTLGVLTSLAIYSLERSGRIYAWTRWIPTIIYALFIFLLSNQSFSVTTEVNTDLFHPVEYFTLALFLCWSQHPIWKEKGTMVFCVRVWGASLVFAASDEFHQVFVPQRFPSFLDLLLDGLGFSAGLAIYHLLAFLRRRPPKSSK